MTYVFLFYWLSWLLWGITTFFMNKKPLRFIFSCLILVIILCSNIYYSIGGYDISLSFVLLIIACGFLYTNLTKSLYHLFASFIIMIGYSATLFWQHPISLSLFISEFFFTPIICSVLVTLLIKGLFHRLMISILGISAGQVLHGFILSSYQLSITIGDVGFFIELYMVIFYLLSLHILHGIKTRWYALINVLY